MTETFADRLRRLRTERAFTVGELSASVGVSPSAIRQLESGQIKNPSLALGLRIANSLHVDAEYLALGEGHSTTDHLQRIDARLDAIERRLNIGVEAKMKKGLGSRVSQIGVLSLKLDDHHALDILEAIERYPSHLRERVCKAGIRVVLIGPFQGYRDYSPYLRSVEPNIDEFEQPPAGLFVVNERCVYLRHTSPLVVAHEYAHAIDCALANGDGYFSDENQEIQVAFRDATSFITPHAKMGVDEYFAEGMRAMAEVNDNRSPYSRVTRERLRRTDPTLYEILAPLFDGPRANAETPAAPPVRQHPKARIILRSALPIPRRNHGGMGDKAGMESLRPTLADVQAAIDKLGREDRANLRPWILARYDVRGERARGFAGPTASSIDE